MQTGAFCREEIINWHKQVCWRFSTGLAGRFFWKKPFYLSSAIWLLLLSIQLQCSLIWHACCLRTGARDAISVTLTVMAFLTRETEPSETFRISHVPNRASGIITHDIYHNQPLDWGGMNNFPPGEEIDIFLFDTQYHVLMVCEYFGAIFSVVVFVISIVI